MPLALAQLVRTNVAGTEVWFTDNTRIYAAVTNVGGWGAPNPALNQSALLVYIYQTVPSADGTTSTKVPLSALTSALAYNAANTNDIQQSIGFGYHTDGHYTSVEMMFPVSSNGIATLAGATIVTDDYFYMTGSIYKKAAGGGNTLITDYSLLPAVTSIIKTTANVQFFNKLSVKKELEYYRQYRDARNANDPDLASAIRLKIDDLEIDLAGAAWEFAAGYYTQAENIVAEMLERHEIPTP